MALIFSSSVIPTEQNNDQGDGSGIMKVYWLRNRRSDRQGKGVAMDQAVVKTTGEAGVTTAIVDGEGDNVSHETPRFMAIKQ